MSIDERLAAYVHGQWTDLVRDAAELCPNADGEAAENLALSALTRVALRWRLVADKDHPDVAVQRALVRAGRKRHRREDREDIQLMDVGYADRPAQPPADPELSPAPPPPLAADVAIAALSGRVRQGQRRRAVAASALAVVVGVGAVVALTGSGKPSVPAPQLVSTAVASVAFPRAPVDFATDVTAGGGYVWTIETRPAPAGSRTSVVERDPKSGHIETRYRVPAPDNRIAYGLGLVWTWRDGDDARDTAMATIDPRGSIDSARSTPAVKIQDAAFTARTAWFTEPLANAVVGFEGGLLQTPSRTTVTGAQFVVPLSASSVLVAGGFGSLHVLPGGLAVVDPAATFLTLLAPAPPYGFWIAHDNRLTFQSGIKAAPSLTLRLPLAVASVTGDPAHGVYVATRSENPRHYDPYIVYYSPAALQASQPRPTARLDGFVQAESMVADPAGGVVVTTNDGAVVRWDPIRAGS